MIKNMITDGYGSGKSAKVTDSDNELHATWEVSISHHHVLYIFKVEGDKDIGFLTKS